MSLSFRIELERRVDETCQPSPSGLARLSGRPIVRVGHGHAFDRILAGRAPTEEVCALQPRRHLHLSFKGDKRLQKKVQTRGGSTTGKYTRRHSRKVTVICTKRNAGSSARNVQ